MSACEDCSAAEERGKKAGVEEEQRLKAVIHHMTLEVEFFGKHDPSCCAAGQPATAPECECGLRETLAFGVEQSGMPLEPPPMTPEEAVKLHEAGLKAVQGVLNEARSLALTPTAQEKHEFEGCPAEKVECGRGLGANRCHAEVLVEGMPVAWCGLTASDPIHSRAQEKETGGVDEA